MSKIVHFDTGKIFETKYARFSRMECGLDISVFLKNRSKRLTLDKSKVTCKNCLKKLGIKPKPFVDYLKLTMAK